MVIDLKSPITFDGERIESVDLNLEQLSGEDLVAVERQIVAETQGRGEALMAVELDPMYLVSVAARAAGKPVELLLKLKAVDYNRVKAETRDFLLCGM